MKNIDKKTVEDFGEEWNKYNQSSIPDEEIKKSDVQIWNYPNKKELIQADIYYLHLGDFIFWDEQKQTEFIINKYSWMSNKRVENTYKGYKSNECVMAGIHDYFNFIKRGVGRSTLQASDDVRRGLINCFLIAGIPDNPLIPDPLIAWRKKVSMLS